MHNFIKLLLFPAILTLFLCGCSGQGAVEFIDKSYKTERITVDLQIPQLTSLKDKDLQEQVNEDIYQTCMDFLGKFKSASEDISSPSVFIAETKKFEKGTLLSLVTQIDYYTQKPHNNSFRITKTVDTRTSTQLRLKDLFEGDGYIDRINATLEDITLKNPDSYKGLWAKPQLGENQGFYITDQALVVYFPPYELSYYSRGFVEFSIPLSDLSGYMTEEYRQML